MTIKEGNQFPEAVAVTRQSCNQIGAFLKAPVLCEKTRAQEGVANPVKRSADNVYKVLGRQKGFDVRGRWQGEYSIAQSVFRRCKSFQKHADTRAKTSCNAASKRRCCW